MYVQRLNTLESEEDEKKVQEVLARLKAEVSRRRLLLYPYFKDFDRVRDTHSELDVNSRETPDVCRGKGTHVESQNHSLNGCWLSYQSVSHQRK